MKKTQTIQQPKCKEVKKKKAATIPSAQSRNSRGFELVKAGLQSLLMNPAFFRFALVRLPDLGHAVNEFAKKIIACICDYDS